MKPFWERFENSLLLSVTLPQVLLLLISQFQELLCTSHKEFWGVSIQIQKIFLCLSLSLCLSHFLSILRQGHVTPSTSLKFKWNFFLQWYFILSLFVCLFSLSWVYCPTREFFTHMETSPLPLKGCTFWPLFGTYCHWTVKMPHLRWHRARICL